MSGAGGVSGAPGSAEADMECVVKEEPPWGAEGALWAVLCGKRERGFVPDTIYAEDADFDVALSDASGSENVKIRPAPAEGVLDHEGSVSHTDPGVSGATSPNLHDDKPIVIKPGPIKLERNTDGDYLYYYECPICQKIVKRELKRHLLTHTREEIDTIIDVRKRGKGNYECHFCGLRMLRRRGIIDHLNVYAGLDPFQQQLHAKMPRLTLEKNIYECDACGKRLGRKDSLAEHVARHAADEPVTCGHCNEPFRYGWELLDHIKLGICKGNIKVSPYFSETQEDFELKPCFVKLERLSFINNDKTFDEKMSENDFSLEGSLLNDGFALGTDEETYYCGVCEEQFEVLSSLMEHQCKRIKRFACNFCDKRFIHQCLLDAHIRIHTDVKPFSCEICEKSFRIKGQLKNHKVAHTDEKPTCRICEKQFTSAKSLRCHQLLHTGEKPKKPYSCKMCDKKFKFPCELETHTRSHTGERTLTCDVCKKQFLRKQHLRKHLQTHTDEKHPCHLCETISNTIDGLKIHMKVHSDEKPYSCGVCNKQFRLSSYLDNHKRVHTGEKPFECEFCLKRFKQNAHLFTHRRTHTGEKPFNCTVCNKQFSEKCKLRLHNRVHTGEKPYSCDVCEKTFSHTSSLKGHRFLHTGEKPFACGVCMKAFARKSHMTDHMQCHSKDWPFSCDICQRRFQKRDYLRLHKKNVHNNVKTRV